MHKNKPLLALSVFVVIALVIVGLHLVRSSDLTNEAIKQKFDCGRVTADFRETDVYCSNPQLYRDHLKTNSVIK